MLNEIEKGQLQNLAENESLVGALRKVFLENILEDDLLHNNLSGTDNQRLGEYIRARFEAVKLLEKGFIKLNSIKKVEMVKREKINTAR